MPHALAVIGTDTGVGKTTITTQLCRGLRTRGWRVFVHKPVACGGFTDGTAEDGRTLSALAAESADGQDPTTVCPHQFPGECSPHLAAAAVGAVVQLGELVVAIARLRHELAAQPGPGLLLVETAGGLLTPLTSARETNADLLVATGLDAVLVTRTRLGTFNHTSLTIAEARRRGIALHGLIANRLAHDDAALADTAAELRRLTGLAVLAEIDIGADERAALSATIAHARS